MVKNGANESMYSQKSTSLKWKQIEDHVLQCLEPWEKYNENDITESIFNLSRQIISEMNEAEWYSG